MIIDRIENRGPWKFTKFAAVAGQQIAICDRCGTMLSCPVAMVNAAGERVTVGSDCARIAADNETNEARRAEMHMMLNNKEKLHRKELAAARVVSKKNEIETMLADDAARAQMASKPHPNFAGSSLLAYAEWMMKHSGAAGRAKLLKTVKASLAA